MAKIGDLLSIGLIGISFWVLSVTTGFMPSFGKWGGIIGSVVTIIVEGYFLINFWRKR